MDHTGAMFSVNETYSQNGEFNPKRPSVLRFAGTGRQSTNSGGVENEFHTDAGASTRCADPSGLGLDVCDPNSCDAESRHPTAGCQVRSEERRVGKECRSRWSTEH